MRTRKMIGLFCAIVMSLTLVLPANAASASCETNASFDENVLPPISAGYAVLVENGIPRLITSEEVELLKNQVELVENTFIPGPVTRETTYKFTATTTTKKYDTSRTTKVSPGKLGPGGITLGESHTIGWEYSIEGSVTLTPDIIAAFDASISLAMSASTSKTFTVEDTVPAGKYGAIYFTPRMRTSVGTLEIFKNWGYSTHQATIIDPVKVGDFADGFYELKTASTLEGLPD